LIVSTVTGDKRVRHCEEILYARIRPDPKIPARLTVQLPYISEFIGKCKDRPIDLYDKKSDTE